MPSFCHNASTQQQTPSLVVGALRTPDREMPVSSPRLPSPFLPDGPAVVFGHELTDAIHVDGSWRWTGRL